MPQYEQNKALHSTYFIDKTVDIKILDAEHPTTAGLGDFTLTDTFYGNISIAEDVAPLLGSTDPDVSKTIAWTHCYKNSKVVYFMPGYTEKAYKNSSYRKFVKNSLEYVADSAK